VHVVGLSEHYRHIFEITRLADFMSFFAERGRGGRGRHGGAGVTARHENEDRDPIRRMGRRTGT
jgi:hypothetical protein